MNYCHGTTQTDVSLGCIDPEGNIYNVGDYVITKRDQPVNCDANPRCPSSADMTIRTRASFEQNEPVFTPLDEPYFEDVNFQEGGYVDFTRTEAPLNDSYRPSSDFQGTEGLYLNGGRRIFE